MPKMFSHKAMNHTEHVAKKKEKERAHTFTKADKRELEVNALILLCVMWECISWDSVAIANSWIHSLLPPLPPSSAPQVETNFGFCWTFLFGCCCCCCSSACLYVSSVYRIIHFICFAFKLSLCTVRFSLFWCVPIFLCKAERGCDFFLNNSNPIFFDVNRRECTVFWCMLYTRIIFQSKYVVAAAAAEQHTCVRITHRHTHTHEKRKRKPKFALEYPSITIK